MSFLPDDYVMPDKVGNWMKLLPGPNRFRILGSFTDEPKTAIMGWEAWDTSDGRKPVRFRMAEPPAKGSYEEDAKHFWAFTVYNVNLKSFQILQLTQKSILDELNKFCADKDWGDPKGYDIEIFRIGEDKGTKYQTQPKPHSEVSEEAKASICPVDLERMFDGEDPFDFVLQSAPEVDDDPGF
tara:strand:- start:3371 stop:3919 length:549 start_codon:yes stop_codon:yes gene_type:complete